MGLEIMEYIILGCCTLMVVAFVQVQMWKDTDAK